MNISVIGLGKLGLCSAACFASRGHNVIGVDKNRVSVEMLSRCQCPIDEPGLPELLDECRGNLEITDDYNQAIEGSDITLIVVPTPSRDDGRFSNQYVEDVLRAVTPALAAKDEFHVVDVVSTVMPGSCEKSFIPMLELLTGKKCGRDFGLVYNPEFIAIGSVIRDFLNPDMVLIGASDEHSLALTRQMYEATCLSDPHIACTSLVNAEVAKLSLNCFVTMKISFANELASICERTEGADVDAVTNAIGADSRISRKYLKGGLGFGGPCFPRDNLAFQAFAREVGATARLGPQVVAVNESVVERIYDAICANVPNGGKIAILGLPYKADTHIIEQSQSVMLAERLLETEYSLSVHDPKALEAAADRLGESVAYHSDVYECVGSMDAVVLMTNWPEYSAMDWERVEASLNEGGFLLDTWRIADAGRFGKIRYMGLGVGPSGRGVAAEKKDNAWVAV